MKTLTAKEVLGIVVRAHEGDKKSLAFYRQPVPFEIAYNLSVGNIGGLVKAIDYADDYFWYLRVYYIALEYKAKGLLMPPIMGYMSPVIMPDLSISLGELDAPWHNIFERLGYNLEAIIAERQNEYKEQIQNLNQKIDIWQSN